MKMETKKRFDGFAVASFVLSLIPLALILFTPLLGDRGGDMYALGLIIVLLIVLIYIAPVLSVLSLIFGIVALKRIKKEVNKKGKKLAVIGLSISIFFIVVAIGVILTFYKNLTWWPFT